MEDNRDSRELVVKVLRVRGYEVVEAVDGEEALRLVQKQRPDLILMDISLPRMDGHAVTRCLKGTEDFKAIPVIALTAHAMKGDREKALAAGCNGYIAKPINVRELPEQIKQFFSRESG